MNKDILAYLVKNVHDVRPQRSVVTAIFVGVRAEQQLIQEPE